MKRKSICLLAGLLIASTAGMATAAAFIIKDATNSSITENVTGTLVLSYGENQQWSNIESLSPTNPKFSTIVLNAPIKSKNVNDEAEFVLTLSAQENCSIEGLTVTISTNDWQEGSGEDGKVATLDAETTRYTATINDAKTYFLKYEISQEAYDEYVKISETEDVRAITQAFGGKLVAHYGRKNA